MAKKNKVVEKMVDQPKEDVTLVDVLDKYMDSTNTHQVSIFPYNPDVKVMGEIRTGKDKPLFNVVINTTQVSKIAIGAIVADLEEAGIPAVLVFGVAHSEETAKRLGIQL